MKIVELRALLTAIYRLPGMVDRLEHAMDRIRDGTERVLSDMHNRPCTVLLLGTTPKEQAGVCCAWTGIVRSEMESVDASIRGVRTMVPGAWLVCTGGALFSSVRVGMNEQFSNTAALAACCQLSDAVLPGMDVAFRLRPRP